MNHIRKHPHKTRALFACFILILTAAQAKAEGATAYSGLWWNEPRDGIFELVITEEGIEGITRWAEEPRMDVHNPDPVLKDRALKDIVFLWGFDYEPEKNRWKDGKVYDPNNGKTYDAQMSLEDKGETLKMRGYMGIALLGRTAKFKRVKPEEMPETLKEQTKVK